MDVRKTYIEARGTGTQKKKIKRERNKTLTSLLQGKKSIFTR